MSKLKLLYLNDICKESMSNNVTLWQAYQEYLDTQNPVPDPRYQYEQPEYHARLYNIIADSYKNAELENYQNCKDIEGLLEYIFQISHLSGALQDVLLNTSLPFEDTRSFLLADAHLSDFTMDLQHRKCIIIFTNVIVYPDIKDESGMVAAADIKLVLEEVSTVEIQGIFNSKDIGMYHVPHTYLTQESDALYCFSFLIPVGIDGIHIDILFKDHSVDVKPVSYFRNE